MDHSGRDYLAAGLALPAAAAASRSSGQPAQAESDPASASPAFGYRILGKTGLQASTVGFGCRITWDGSVVERAAEEPRFPTHAEGYGQFAPGGENFLQLPSGQADVKRGNSPGRTVKCPYGARVSERLNRAQEIFAC
jgi:hypothetical protein